MKKILAASFAIGLLVVLGCVNIPSKFEAHITIDIRQHIEQQAASTLDFIEGKTDELPALESPAPAKEGASLLHQIREQLSPMRTAYAAEKLKESSPLITEIAQGLRERNEAIKAIKGKEYAGETNRGYLELRDAEKIVDAEERNETQRLIAAENKDRKALYGEIARLNKDQNVSVSEVEQIYAFERLKRAKPGEIFQLPAAGEDFDAFKESPAGKSLGEECKPEAWVTIK
jgi:uncharacterized protein YdbL (DUF1318 family)